MGEALGQPLGDPGPGVWSGHWAGAVRCDKAEEGREGRARPCT